MGDLNTGQGKKIELPSSGLAEDILGSLSAVPGPEAVNEKTGQTTTVSRGWDYEDKDGAAEGSEIWLHLVSFYLGPEEYALEISQVREIIRVNRWTRVPNAPAHVKGVINLRGRIIPVFDPKVRMALPDTPLTRNARVMIVESGPKAIGMLVDGVHQVLKLPLSVVEPPPEEVSGADKGYIRGVGKLSERLIILLDFAKLTASKMEG